MATILDKIRVYKLAEVAARKLAFPLSGVEERARNSAPVRPFAQALRQAAKNGYGLIAEIKKASPSKGVIRAQFDVSALGRAYQAGGAACLSVLTDRPSFMGEDVFLSQARAATGLPVLRKDFLYDPYQVAESRALGADCILVIMAAVSDAQAQELSGAAREWGMDVLVEVHDAGELERAAGLNPALLGINNRDLRTFETSLSVTEWLIGDVPGDCQVVSESGLGTRADLARLAAVGARSFLVGESLMRQADVEAATRALLADPLMPEAV